MAHSWILCPICKGTKTLILIVSHLKSEKSLKMTNRKKFRLVISHLCHPSLNRQWFYAKQKLRKVCLCQNYAKKVLTFDYLNNFFFEKTCPESFILPCLGSLDILNFSFIKCWVTILYHLKSCVYQKIKLLKRLDLNWPKFSARCFVHTIFFGRYYPINI